MAKTKTINKKESKQTQEEFHYSRAPFIAALANASKLLTEHKEDVNRLNVFPVPDGDTGTNMSLTLETVVEHVKKLGPNPSVVDIRSAVTTGALMGARGNSGVITSQILRGLCEGYEGHDVFDTQGLASAFSKAEEVAFAAVRKPVEGTILTVLKDSAKAARYAYRKKMRIDEAVQFVSDKAYESVESTPEYLPVLKENNVVDAGGYGLAIFIEGIAQSLTGNFGLINQELEKNAEESYQPKVEIEQINDWAGSKYMYCNEFLVESETLDTQDALKHLAKLGDCELCVGATPKFKVHVHSNNPDKVLAYFLKQGQISEVFIHNMQLQSEDRVDKLNSDVGDYSAGTGKVGGSASDSSSASQGGTSADSSSANNDQQTLPHKRTAVVAVCAGDGNAEILKSLGVDVCVSGGQTMNPSTKDLADAATRANADNIIFLPNNKNIILAAKSACDVLDCNAAVVETKTIPNALTAMINYDQDASLDDNVEVMTESFATQISAEITFAIKDSKDVNDNPIKNGDCIGIVGGDIISVTKDVDSCVSDLLEKLNAYDMDVLTILFGSDYDESKIDALCQSIEDKYEDLEVDHHLGKQPLYPVIFGLEKFE